MRIGIIGSIWISTPPRNFGFGAQEYLAYHLAEALVKRGHDVTLFASGDSQTHATLKSITDKQVKDIPCDDTKIKDIFELMNLKQAYTHAQDFDIFHNHLLPFGMFFAELTTTPTIHTLHHQIYKNRGDYHAYLQYKNQSFISISNTQRTVVPELNYIATVYNGVDTTYFTFQERPTADYLLCIGRIKRYKGMHTAINIARKLHLKLKIAAPLPQASQPDFKEVNDYWENDIKPHLGGDIEYVGAVEGQQKVDLLQNAKALLFPVERQEPFGMTIVEAMSTGTPVIAYANGAAPEIIVDAQTGYLVDQQKGVAGMEAAIQTLYSLSPEAYSSFRHASRKHVEQYFTIDKMVDGYEKAYSSLIK